MFEDLMQNLMQIKDATSFGNDMETKVVRHVRTPAGVVRFKLPIGSVIVGGRKLNNIRSADSEFDGWDKYVSNRNKRNYYVGKSEDGVLVVVDKDDNILWDAERQGVGDKYAESSALRFIDYEAGNGRPRPKIPFPGSPSETANEKSPTTKAPRKKAPPKAPPVTRGPRPVANKPAVVPKDGNERYAHDAGVDIEKYRKQRQKVIDAYKSGRPTAARLKAFNDAMDKINAKMNSEANKNVAVRNKGVVKDSVTLDMKKPGIDIYTEAKRLSTSEILAHLKKVKTNPKRGWVATALVDRSEMSKLSNDQLIEAYKINSTQDAWDLSTLDRMLRHMDANTTPTDADNALRSRIAGREADLYNRQGTVNRLDFNGHAPVASSDTLGNEPIVSMMGVNDQPTGILRKVATDEPGWDKFVDGPVARYIGKDQGEYVVVDENDNVIAAAKRKPDAVALMHEVHDTEYPDDSVKKFPRKARGRYNKTPKPENIARDKLAHAESERQIRDHAKQHGYSIPPNAKNVMLSQNPDDPSVQNLAAYVQVGGASDGKIQIRPKQSTTEANSAKKFDRVERFAVDVVHVDRAITPSSMRDDNMAVLALMRRLGARVGSNKRVGTVKDDNEPRGITELSNKDVTFSASGKTATIEYAGKKFNAKTGAGWQHYEVTDPDLVKMLWDRQKQMGKNPDAPFFPESSAAKTMALSRKLTGSNEYTNHDYRRLFATEQARALVKAVAKEPRTAAEVQEATKKIGSMVDEMLNDKDQALKSYIDPRVFDVWNKRVGN